jgi:hypothetical protein
MTESIRQTSLHDQLMWLRHNADEAIKKGTYETLGKAITRATTDIISAMDPPMHTTKAKNWVARATMYKNWFTRGTHMHLVRFVYSQMTLRSGPQRGWIHHVGSAQGQPSRQTHFLRLGDDEEGHLQPRYNKLEVVVQSR